MSAIFTQYLECLFGRSFYYCVGSVQIVALVMSDNEDQYMANNRSNEGRGVEDPSEYTKVII